MTIDHIAVWAEAPRPSDRQPVMGQTASPTGLPWPHQPADLKHFREVTRDRVLIMGRTTFDHLPAALKSRRSLAERPIVVLTADQNRARLIDDYPGLNIQPVSWAREDTAEDLLNMASCWWGDGPHRGTAVIGGRTVIELFAPFVDRLEVTFFTEPYEGDVPAPSTTVFNGFAKAVTTHHHTDPTIDFVTFTKE